MNEAKNNNENVQKETRASQKVVQKCHTSKEKKCEEFVIALSYMHICALENLCVLKV